MSGDLVPIRVGSWKELSEVLFEAPVTYLYVYRGTPGPELQAFAARLGPDERCLLVDCDDVPAEMLAGWTIRPDLDCRAAEVPKGSPWQLPYLRGYVAGMGFIHTTRSLDEIDGLVARARAERAMILRLRAGSKPSSV
jgi:hypothetical protein